MSDKKVRILGIAPYEGMRSIMLKAAEARNDIDLTVYVGDLQEGAEIAKRSFHDNYDIIISRGGTAELIGQTAYRRQRQMCIRDRFSVPSKWRKILPPAMPS